MKTLAHTLLELEEESFDVTKESYETLDGCLL